MYTNSFTNTRTRSIIADAEIDRKTELLSIVGFRHLNVASNTFCTTLEIGMRISVEKVNTCSINELKYYLLDLKKTQYEEVLQKMRQQLSDLERYRIEER